MPTILETFFKAIEQLPGYEHRPAQARMVEAVFNALNTSQSLIIEAGTGSGKSFGYLIPALLQPERPIVVSTGTITLQEQLINKDLPVIQQLMNLPNLQVKLAKGRRNYLCLQKLAELERHVSHNSREQQYISYLYSSISADWDGDLAHLDWSIPKDLWAEVASESEDCLGRQCRFYAQNPYRLAREDLADADVIVVNHALYLMDLASGQAILPPHPIVIFDEAHQLPQVALNALTTRVGKYATAKLLQKIHRRLRPIPEAFHQQIADTESRLLEWLFRAHTQSGKNSFRLYPDTMFNELINTQRDVLSDVLAWLNGLDVKQLPLIETELDADRAAVQKDKLLDQLQGLIDRLGLFTAHNGHSASSTENPAGMIVNWAETNTDKLYYELKSTPIAYADYLSSKLWQQKTAVLTSATLSSATRSSSQSLDYFQDELGLKNAETLILPGVFHYAQQSLLYLPQGMPDPHTPEFTQACAMQIQHILAATHGRAFVLCTSNQHMQQLASQLLPQLAYPCKLQGDLPKPRLIEWFKSTPNSVLFATASFWEGVDVPGNALSAVIIDKLPFSAPDDPIQQAVVEAMKRQGKDWFTGYVLPNAIMRLKQGVGRLIRSKEDRGVVAILDPRIGSKGYGKRVLASLPPMPVTHNLKDLEGFLMPTTFASAKP